MTALTRNFGTRGLLTALWMGMAFSLPRPSCQAEPSGRPEAPRTLVGKDGAVMVLIPPSDFLMGSREKYEETRTLDPAKPLRPLEIIYAMGNPAWTLADERPARKVYLSSFAIDCFEVTNRMYRTFLEAIQSSGDHSRCYPGEPPGKDHTPRYWKEYNPLLKNAAYARTTPFQKDTFTADNKPVVGVDWFDAYAYAAWAEKRLPTEAEWERAARGTDGRRWPWGNQWEWGRANIGPEKLGQDVPAKGREKDGFVYPAPVRQFEKGASPDRCLNMAGNVAEWCADWYQEDYYRQAPASDPPGPRSGKFRSVRGGSSRNLPSSVRCAKRFSYEPEYRNFDLGFRCASDAK